MMTKNMFLLLNRHLGGAIANKLSTALSDEESASLYDELNQLEGGIRDPKSPPELASWKEWTFEEIVQYARKGSIPNRPQVLS